MCGIGGWEGIFFFSLSGSLVRGACLFRGVHFRKL